MATLSEVMRYALDLDTKGFTSGLKSAEGDAKQSFDNIEDSGEQTSGRFEGIGGKMGTALVAGFAAIGVGAILLQGVQQSMDKAAGKNLLQGQFDLTSEQAEQFGEIAGELYAEGWGTGLQEVQQVVGLAAERLGATTEAELEGISRKVLAVSKTWGDDFDAVIRSTDQLVQNDLAPNAEAALDLIVGAFQEGGNEAGDLLDTIDEYSQHWSDMGLSGEDALNQVIHGLKNGQRDADKLADAVKEMRIRVVDDSELTAEAYADLGLDADKLRAKFLEGGPAAREAFLEVIGALQAVEDPYEQNRVAVSLIGTQFEDLGTGALESLGAVDGALDNTTGKAETLAATVEASGWVQLRREGESALTDVGDVLATAFVPALEDANEGVDLLKSGFGLWGDSGSDDAELVGDATSRTRDDVLDLIEAIDDTNKAAGAVGDEAPGDFAKVDRSIGKVWGQLVEAKNKAKDFASSAQARLKTVEGEARKTEAAVEAIKAAFGRMSDELSDRSAYLDVVDNFETVRAELEETGAVSERTSIAMKQDVIDYAVEVGDIPPAKVTEINALIDRGAFDEALAIIAEIERRRQIDVNITTYYRTVGSAPGAVQPNQGGPRARGGPTYPGLHEVIENGPELLQHGGKTFLMSEGGGNVVPLNGSTNTGRVNGSGPTINLTVNAGLGTDGPQVGRQLVDWLESFYRSGGQPPRSA